MAEDQDDGTAAPAGGWVIPAREPTADSDGGGWDDGAVADRSRAGAQWVQPPSPGLRPPTPTTPPKPFAPTWAAPAAPPAPAAAPPLFPPAPRSGAQVVVPAAQVAAAPAAASPAGWLADIGAAVAVAINLGVLMQ